MKEWLGPCGQGDEWGLGVRWVRCLRAGWNGSLQGTRQMNGDAALVGGWVWLFGVGVHVGPRSWAAHGKHARFGLEPFSAP